jgi:hypothetical protein
VVLINSTNPNRLKQRDNVGTNDLEFLLHEVGKGRNHKMAKNCSFFEGGFEC